MWFEPKTIKSALFDWTIKPGNQVALKSNFVQLIQFFILFSNQISFQPLISSVTNLFQSKSHTEITWYHECSGLSGVQSEIFQSRGSFGELGHFDKHFVKNLKKKVPQGKILEFFLLDTLKTTFWMEILTQRWTLSGPFFPKSGYFL